LFPTHHHKTSTTNLTHPSARLFTSSFESAIYLLSSICSVPSHTTVLPAINTNFTHHISAGLANGTIITGQNSISHPSISTALESSSPTASNSPTHDEETERHDMIEDANLPGSLPTLRKQYISFSKADEEDLPARIQRIWYINPYGQEIRLSANPRVVDALRDAQTVIYSIGSLYTSLVPSLILKGVGEALANPGIRYKILILNSTTDRETGPSAWPFAALDFVAAVANACAGSRALGTTSSMATSNSSAAVSKPEEYRQYVTHLIHLTGPGTPVVDKEALERLGIECIKVYGRKMEGEAFVRYDEKALVQALEVTMGRRDPVRRNTLKA
jgi:2-phospho-L-lactate transferase/gluconeogenesis factor (CofD/UPF0052 family)